MKMSFDTFVVGMRVSVEYQNGVGSQFWPVYTQTVVNTCKQMWTLMKGSN